MSASLNCLTVVKQKVRVYTWLLLCLYYTAHLGSNPSWQKFIFCWVLHGFAHILCLAVQVTVIFLKSDVFSYAVIIDRKLMLLWYHFILNSSSTSYVVKWNLIFPDMGSMLQVVTRDRGPTNVVVPSAELMFDQAVYLSKFRPWLSLIFNCLCI